MSSLGEVERWLKLVPTELTAMLRFIDQAQGRQTAFRLQHPQQLEVLQAIARIQSTEASNEIEGITAPHHRVRALVEERATPANRSEEEIAAYRKVLDLIHSTDPTHIPFTSNVVRQFHGMLHEFSPGMGGSFKSTDNVVTEELPDGSTRERFVPVAAWKTPQEMDDLHKAYEHAVSAGIFHPLLVIGLYVLDFLVIHPFRDGNGRMSRLLTLLLLYSCDYEVGRFMSIEKIIAETKGSYYDALHASTQEWHTNSNNPIPWLSYFLGVLIAAYKGFEQRVGAIAAHGSKSAAVRTYIRSSLSDEFTIKEIRAACPGVSDDSIRAVLLDFRRAGVVVGISRGPAARYRRLRTDV